METPAAEAMMWRVGGTVIQLLQNQVVHLFSCSRATLRDKILKNTPASPSHKKFCLKKGRASALCHLFPTLCICEHRDVHKGVGFTAPVRTRTGNLIPWFIDLCWGYTDLRCSLAVQQSLVCLAHVAPGLNRLNRAQKAAQRQMMRCVLIQAKPADVGVEHYQPAPAEPLGFEISIPLQLGSCKIAPIRVRGICVMDFSWLTMGRDLSHTHQGGLWSAAGKLWWVQMSGSLLSLTLAPIQTHGRLPVSLGVNKGKHKTSLFPMALCSWSIFSPADDLFAYPKCLIKYIHQNEDPNEFFLEHYSVQQVTPLQCQFHMSLWESRHWVYDLISISEFNNLQQK